MKQIKYWILGVCLLLITTGCVKMDFSMGIYPDKSMDFEMIEAVDKSLFESGDFQTTETTNQKELDKLKRAGFKIVNYYEEGKKGYKITKHFKSIDDVSSQDEIIADLGLDNLAKSGILFQVTPGFLKNQYQAKFTMQEGSSLAGSNETEMNLGDLGVDIKELSEDLELKFSLKLPYKVKENNATKVEEDGKTLTWNLLEMNGENIEFSFELYNLGTVILVGIAGLFFSILLLALLRMILRPGRKRQRILPEFSQDTSFTNTNM